MYAEKTQSQQTSQKWEQKDEKLLCQLHKIFDKDYYKKWEQISKIFPGRSSKAIKKISVATSKKIGTCKEIEIEHKKREREKKTKLAQSSENKEEN